MNLNDARLEYPQHPNAEKIEKFINEVDRLRCEFIDIGDATNFADVPLGLPIARKFPDDASKKEVLRREMKWSEIKHSLRLDRNLFRKRSNQRKSAAPTDKPAVRFSFCKRNNHKTEDCRKRLAKEAAKTTESTGRTEKPANKKAKIGSIIDQQIKKN